MSARSMSEELYAVDRRDLDESCAANRRAAAREERSYPCDAHCGRRGKDFCGGLWLCDLCRDFCLEELNREAYGLGVRAA